MKLYCMCTLTGQVPDRAIDSQGFGPPDNQVYLAPNRFCPTTLNEDDEAPCSRPILLTKSMEMLCAGVEQRVADTPNGVPNKWPRSRPEAERDMQALISTRRHHPNVDLYRCPHCGAMVCVE